MFVHLDYELLKSGILRFLQKERRKQGMMERIQVRTKESSSDVIMMLADPVVGKAIWQKAWDGERSRAMWSMYRI